MWYTYDVSHVQLEMWTLEKYSKIPNSLNTISDDEITDCLMKGNIIDLKDRYKRITRENDIQIISALVVEIRNASLRNPPELINFGGEVLIYDGCHRLRAFLYLQVASIFVKIEFRFPTFNMKQAAFDRVKKRVFDRERGWNMNLSTEEGDVVKYLIQKEENNTRSLEEQQDALKVTEQKKIPFKKPKVWKLMRWEKEILRTKHLFTFQNLQLQDVEINPINATEFEMTFIYNEPHPNFHENRFVDFLQGLVPNCQGLSLIQESHSDLIEIIKITYPFLLALIALVRRTNREEDFKVRCKKIVGYPLGIGFVGLAFGIIGFKAKFGTQVQCASVGIALSSFAAILWGQ